MRKRLAAAGRCAVLLCWTIDLAGQAETQESAETGSPTTTLSATTTLVRVPAMVTIRKTGEPAFTLKASDFHVTDDGVAQQVTLDDEAGGQPLALVIAIETGGAGGRHLAAAGRLPTFLDSIVGGVPHRVALVSFDSSPVVVEPFTEDLPRIGEAVAQLQAGDNGATTLDALKLSVALLRGQPLQYRRAVLLISETVDHGSHVGLAEVLRSIGESNTTIYSMAFNSSRSAATHETSKLFSGPPGPAHGCMSKGTEEEDLASDTSDNRFVQAYDCLSLLAPPLRLVKIATLVAMDSLRKNVPESVARQTGGEYATFNDAHGLERGLQAISNHLPNQYILSFHPQAPHPGLHTIGLELSEYPNLVVAARSSYWADGAAPEPPGPLP